MQKRLILFILLILILSGVPGSLAAPAPAWTSKVDPWVLQTSQDGETEFLVFLTEQADLSAAAGLKSKTEKGAYVYQTLTEVARRTQPGLLGVLRKMGIPHRSYWVANMVWVRGGLSAIQSLAQRPDVARLAANPRLRLELPSTQPNVLEEGEAVEAGTWNIIKINADDVWALGYTGQGAVVGGADTGYAWNHPALKRQYRGWDGISANHNYNWHDAIHDGKGVPCPNNSPQPCDDNYPAHGTHTMGIMVGDDGGSNKIGVAPGARWIGCRNMDDGYGTPETYIECYQWFVAPTDLSGQNPRPDLAPDVINNSWGCPTTEGCNPNDLLSAVQAVRAAGILTVHSAGNSGNKCETVNEPAAIYSESFTVGATDVIDRIANFSSRGPVTVDGSNRMKPNVSAPGVSIYSSLQGGSYGTLDGTSMAAPHVAGLVALLISADPSLRGQVDKLETLIESSALPRQSTQLCGMVPVSGIPNNVFGWGRVDALMAIDNLPQYFYLPLLMR